MPNITGPRIQDPAAVETTTMRKVTWRLVPFLMVLYLVAFLDRVNVGFAALSMNEDAGLSPQVFGTGAAIFFVGYFLFEVPSTVILHEVGARFWIGRVMVTWGIISAAMMFIAGPKSFYALRFLLGLAEAGFFPGVILYLSYWFPARRRAGVTGLFMAAAPVAGVIGAPLSASLLELHGALGLKSWQWMFLVEGLPAILLGIATLWVLTDRPEQARWLDDAERAWLSDAMARERRGAGGSDRHGTWAALADPRVLALALAYLGTSAGLYTVGIWAPLILKGFGLSVAAIGLWAAVPSLVATVGMVLWSRSADRTGAYHWHAALACLVAALGMALAARAGASLLLAVLGLSLGFFGVNAAKPPLWSLPTTFLTGGGAAAGIGLINSLGTLGGSLGPYMVGSGQAAGGGYGRGLLFVGGTLVVSAIVTMILRWAGRPAAPAPFSLEEVDP